VIVASGGLVFCEGRIYALTMLYNLNNRSSRKHGSANTRNSHSVDISNTVNIMAAANVGIQNDLVSLELSDRSKDHSDLFSAREKVASVPFGS
jgi:hypothetical protein